MFFSKSKLVGKLAKSSQAITAALSKLVNSGYQNPRLIEELEESLISADVAWEIAAKITADLAKKKFENEAEIREFVIGELTHILKPCEKTLELNYKHLPQVVIFSGVNGVGKTTTLGKVAARLAKQNKKVLIAACDTFRAAASEQLAIWAQRTGSEIIIGKEGEEPAAVAYQSMLKAKDFDVLLIDTAGRLQNKANLMAELKKINSVIKKIDPHVPHENILVLDATTGKNAEDQLVIFNQVAPVTGLIITKLDGSAKGGVVVSLAKKFAKPIYAIGVGEKEEDLQEFNAREFAQNLV